MGCRCINRLQGDCRKTWPQIRFLIISYSDPFFFFQSITEKHFLGISCGIQRPFVFVTKLLNTLLMCFQDAAPSFSLKAELYPNYSHFEVSSWCSQCHIHLNNLPSWKLQPVCHTLPTTLYIYVLRVLSTYGCVCVCVYIGAWQIVYFSSWQEWLSVATFMTSQASSNSYWASCT